LGHDDRFEVVGQATDGDAVVARLHDFDIALIDPAIHGFGIIGVVERLRHRDPPPATLVVGHTDALHRCQALAAEGVADYLVIPGDLDGLPDRLVTICSSATPLVVAGPGGAR
jgi:DNA-binding NarL/FixJ family response regulator